MVSIFKDDRDGPAIETISEIDDEFGFIEESIYGKYVDGVNWGCLLQAHHTCGTRQGGQRTKHQPEHNHRLRKSRQTGKALCSASECQVRCEKNRRTTVGEKGRQLYAQDSVLRQEMEIGRLQEQSCRISKEVFILRESQRRYESSIDHLL